MDKLKEKEPGFKKFNNLQEAIEYFYPLSTKNAEVLSKDILLIDFDGVLLEIKLNEFLRCLFYYIFLPSKVEEFIKQHKVPISYLYILRKIVKNGGKVIILSSRIVDDKNYFPFISKEKIEKMKSIGIDFYSLKKYLPDLELPKDFKGKLDRERIIYIGSGILDRRVFNIIKKDPDLKNKNLIYAEIESSSLF